jgi:hypothetical protein
MSRARVPPHDLVAEANLLGAMMLDRTAIDAGAALEPDAFYKPAHGHILAAIRKLAEAGAPVEAITVADRLRDDGLLEQTGGYDALVEICSNTPAVTAAGAYAEIVARKATHRALIAAAGEISDAGYNGRTDTARNLLADALARTNGTAAAEAITVVALEQFAAVDEPGADALLGDGSDALLPANSDVMVYGDGGAGKTTLTVDLVCHLGAGDNWLGVTVAAPLRVVIIENEGPRPLFRAKIRRKLADWTGSTIGGRVQVVESPWARLTFADQAHRAHLAHVVAEHDADVVLIGPVARSGWSEAGTLAEVRAFLELVGDVRQQSGRAVTFVLIHHENKAGSVSGAWEGACDTMFHVQGMGHGRTRLHVQKARWSPTWHAQTLNLRWIDGEGFEPMEEDVLSDDDIAERILAVIDENPGTGWRTIEEGTRGIRHERRRTIRDRLLTDGVIVNTAKDKVSGNQVRLDHCPERRPAHLYRADDPTIAHLRPGPGADGAQLQIPGSGLGAPA